MRTSCEVSFVARGSRLPVMTTASIGATPGPPSSSAARASFRPSVSATKKHTWKTCERLAANPCPSSGGLYATHSVAADERNLLLKPISRSCRQRVASDLAVLIDSLDRHSELVACAALGPDIARPGRIDFDLFPQAHDLRVHRAVVDLVVVQARAIQNLVATQDALRRVEQGHQEIELAVAQPQPPAVARPQAAGVQVELPAVEAVGADSPGPALAHPGPAAAQHRPDTGEQLTQTARFREVMVGADLEAHHAVGLLVARGEHDDRDVRFLAQPACDLYPVLATGQAQVEQDEIDRLARHDRGDVTAARERCDAKLVIGEVVSQHLPERRIVIDRDDVWLHCLLSRHGGTSFAVSG